MKILFYDTETTGLPEWKIPSYSDEQPHIVQLAAILADHETQEVISTMDVIIKPDGWDIPEEVIALHGITNEMAISKGISENEALCFFLEMWGGGMRVSHNQTFDQRIVRIATKRYCYDDTIEQWKNRENHKCTMLMAKPIMQMLPKNRYGFKNPKLQEAYKHFTGKDLEEAHNAMKDAKACMEIYFAMCK